jgi:hypothetical protein
MKIGRDFLGVAEAFSQFNIIRIILADNFHGAASRFFYRFILENF